MKDIESFVYGVVFGIMFLTMMMGWFPQDKVCRIEVGHGNGNRTTVDVGVFRGE